ncbi:MAG: type VI secretion system tip protein VgrG, partial [Planctomycetales bacterium]|nr:type VI secretion system tip protein VgrG [Planctomycetales bacterium]
MTRTQQNRAFQVETPLGKDVLLFYRLSGTEKLGALFEFQLEVLSENHSINPDELLGRSVTASVEIDSDKTRYFNGLATTFIQDGCIGDLARYRIAVRPWLWLLTRTADCRIFQNKSVPEIVTEVFKQKGFTDVKKSLNGTYAKREYCVQYSETDFDFASRLLESEGIYYYFAHEKGKHTLVLADGRGSHQTVSGYDKVPYFPPGGTVRRERDHIDSWSFSREVQPGTFATTDFDFTRPKADLQVKSSVKRNHAQSAFEVFNYPGGYLETKDGEGIVRARIEQYHSHFEQSVGTGNARGLATGSLFKLEKFPRQDQNSEYLLTSVTYNIESDSYQSSGGGGD